MNKMIIGELQKYHPTARGDWAKNHYVHFYFSGTNTHAHTVKDNYIS